MWHDDGDWESFYSHPDEENWEKYRTEKYEVVWKLVSLLIKLRVIREPVNKDWKHDYGFDIYGFVDRHWKVK